MSVMAGVEKVRDRNVLLVVIIAAIEFFLSPRVSGNFHSRCCRSTEEPHKPLDVLGHGCREELLPHEPQSAQAQATQSELILEFREQGFHLLSFPLYLRELWRVDQLASALAPHPCEWRDTYIAHWCIAFFANMPHNACRCRYRRERGCEHSGRHS